jgi:hypothetical protein
LCSRHWSLFNLPPASAQSLCMPLFFRRARPSYSASRNHSLSFCPAFRNRNFSLFLLLCSDATHLFSFHSAQLQRSCALAPLVLFLYRIAFEFAQSLSRLVLLTCVHSAIRHFSFVCWLCVCVLCACAVLGCAVPVCFSVHQFHVLSFVQLCFYSFFGLCLLANV